MPEFDSTVEYRDLPNFPGYKCGSDGTVWSCWKSAGGISKHSYLSNEWHELKQVPIEPDGRLIVCLRKDKKNYNRYVQQLILETFVGPRPQGMECCHFPDRDIRNNRLENLRWGTKKDNMADRDAHGTTYCGDNHQWAKVTEKDVIKMFKLKAEGMTPTEMAPLFKITREAIYHIFNGRSRTRMVKKLREQGLI